MDEERMNPVVVILVGISALSFLQYFDTLGSMTERHPAWRSPAPVVPNGLILGSHLN